MPVDGFTACNLDQLADFRNGKFLSASSYTPTGKHPVFGSNGQIARTNELLNPGPVVVIGRVGAYCGSVYGVHEPSWVTDNAIVAEPKSDVDFRFLYYRLKSLDLNRTAIGSAQPLMTQGGLKIVTTLKPSLVEQRAIAGVLGALDDKIELNRRMNETLEAIAQTEFRRMMEDGEGRRSTIGEEVRVVGGSTPSTSKPDFWEGGTHHWATPKDLASLASPVLLDTERRVTDAGLAQISSGLLPAGTVLLSSRAPIGYLVISEVPVAVNQGFIAMVCDKTLPNSFVRLWAQENMDAIVANANGTTFLEISKKNFRPLPVIVPPKPMLDEFVRRVEPLHRRMVLNLQESQTLAALRDALLPKLLSGAVRVKETKA
jgi:type I restriction enzyme S subunit